MKEDLLRQIIISVEITSFFISGFFLAMGNIILSILSLMLGISNGVLASRLIIENALKMKGGVYDGVEKEI